MSTSASHEDAAGGDEGPVTSEARELARGRPAWTLFELIVIVAALVWLVAGAIGGAVLLVWWLA